MPEPSMPEPAQEDNVSLAALVELCAALPRPWLIGVDVDGTLAPIVARPELSQLEPLARDTVEQLTDRVGVTVAIVSGRPLTDLRHRFELPPGALLLGSHGAEIGTEVDHRTADEQGRIESVLTTLEAHQARLPGAWIEHKPLAVAFHVRQVDDAAGEAALAELRDQFEEDDSLTLHRGHKVLEFAIRPTSKSVAFAQLRGRLEPATSFFIGDDSSDEQVFGSLGDGDISVKVGPGATVARHRLARPADVVALLRGLSDSLSRAVR
jgi:trehalose 6-phosphate phosphatase